MNRAAVFFDRDNTLIANDGYLGDPDGVVLISGAASAIGRLRARGFSIVTISNQSGVARGLFPEEAVHAVNARLDEMLSDQDPAARIDRHEFCPYHPDARIERYRQDSDLRKPRPGMIFQAANRLNLDRSLSWVIGDAPRDIAAGHAAGCRTILFTDPSTRPSPAAEEQYVEPDFTAGSLEQAVDIIEQNTMNEQENETSGGAVPQESTEPTNAEQNRTVAASSTDVAGPAEPPSPAPAKRMTFAERVRAGTFQPVRDATVPVAGAVDKSKKAAEASDPAEKRPSASEKSTEKKSPPSPAPDSATVRATEPLEPAELMEPLLQQMLEELRLLRQQSHRGNEFSVTKLLAGITQVMTLPILFLAYLNRGTPADAQSLLQLAIFLQTLTIALYIMSRQ